MSTLGQSLFSKRLVQMRSIRELSQDALAKKAGLPATAISHFEKETRKPSFDNLRKIADALDISIDYLMGRTDDPVGVPSHEAEIFRDYQKMTEQDRELAKDFMARLAARNKENK